VAAPAAACNERDKGGPVAGRLFYCLSDYNAALAIKPDLPASLYGRGLARLRKAGAWVEAEFAGYGLKP